VETTKKLTSDLFRVIDANLNRLREGVRVVEDIARYSHNNTTLAIKLKSLRHQSKIHDLQSLLTSRDSINDVLRPTVESEMDRNNLESIIIANYKRAQESARVLEEMYKVVEPALSETFKNIRYELYSLEKEQLLIP